MNHETVSIASLMLAIPAVWCSPAGLWIAPFSLFVITGLLGGWIAPSALVSMLAFAAIMRFHVSAGTTRTRGIATTLLLVGALALGMHLAPGFATVHLLTELRPPGQTAWSGVRFSADKPLVGLFLLLAYRERLCRTVEDWKRAFTDTAAPMLLGIGGVYAVGIALGHVTIAGTVAGPPFLPMLVLFTRNLLFTVVAEEMLFRQVIQWRLATLYRGENARLFAIATASVLFGLAHLPGGWQYGLLATLAGAVYGYAFTRSGRVEMAMMAHALLNAGSVLLLSTPSS